jgi:imidazole glycerol-phosphate synthase subunit HisH
MKKITLINYGAGNIWSVKNAFEYMGSDVKVSNNPKEISESRKIILPGVGSYQKAMLIMKETGIEEGIKEGVTRGGQIFGICLGMQLLGYESTEGNLTKGLNLIPNKVSCFNTKSIGETLKIPHIGFNTVNIDNRSGLFSKLDDITDFYFAHSFRMLTDDLVCNKGICTYGEKFLAAFEKENIFGTQFHPEKSQANGLKVIKNFINL